MDASKYLGKWYKEKEQGGDWEEFNVLEIVGDQAKAVNKNIPLSQLGTVYKRKHQITIDPFSSPAANVDSSLITDQPEQKQVAMTESSAEEKIIIPQGLGNILAKPEIPQKPMMSRNVNQSKEHQFVRNAIELTNATSSIEFAVIQELPCDLHKLKTVATSLGIDSTIVSEVLIEYIQSNPEKLFDALKNAINQFFEEPGDDTITAKLIDDISNTSSHQENDLAASDDTKEIEEE